jgi:hypothetical protein
MKAFSLIDKIREQSPHSPGKFILYEFVCQKPPAVYFTGGRISAFVVFYGMRRFQRPINLNRTCLHSLIKIVSCIIILLGITHCSFAFPLHMNQATLWFVGAGMSIIFSGLLNLVAIDRNGSKFTKAIALIVNIFNCIMFCFALPILNEPQVYVGITIFLVSSIAFLIDLIRPSIKY